MICGSCGEMLPMEAPASNRPVLLKPLAAKPTEAPKKKKRKRKLKLEMDAVAGLIKGTAFCIGFTFMGALLWAGVAVFLGFELRIIAVALGGLAGYGMALGHNDDNGLLAGIIAGFISFCGIIGAKILIVVFLVATLVAGGMDNLHREMVVQGIAQEIIEQQGGNPANVSLDQRERAVSTARAAVERMDDAQIEAKYNELEAKWENSVPDEPAEAAEPEVADAGENEAAPNEGEATAGDEMRRPRFKRPPWSKRQRRSLSTTRPWPSRRSKIAAQAPAVCSGSSICCGSSWPWARPSRSVAAWANDYDTS